MSIQEELWQNRQYILNEYRSGKGTSALGKEFKCNSGTVYYFLKKLNEPTRGNRRTEICSDDYAELALEKFNRGMSAYAIAKDIHLSKPVVLKLLKKMGCDTSRYNKNTNEVLMKDRTEEIVELHKQGIKANTIGKQLGYSGSQVSVLLNKLGFELTTNLYTANYNLLDTIDNELKAWILGWWYTDGTNDGISMVRLGITDLDVVEKIKEAFEYTGPIHKNDREGRKTIYTLCVNNVHLSHTLTRLGCPKKKTYTTTFPSTDILPVELYKHFLRGALEGDGSISSHYISFTGTEEFLKGIEAVSGYQFNWYTRHPERKNNIRTIMLCKKEEVKNFLIWIYAGAAFYMQRKYDKYQEFLVSLGEHEV